MPLIDSAGALPGKGFPASRKKRQCLAGVENSHPPGKPVCLAQKTEVKYNSNITQQVVSLPVVTAEKLKAADGGALVASTLHANGTGAEKSMGIIEIHKESGGLHVLLQAVSMGRDWNVVITGGERPHLGCIALGVPRPSLQDPERTSATV